MNIPCYKVRYGNRTFSLRFKYKYCNHDKIRNKSLDYFMQKRLPPLTPGCTDSLHPDVKEGNMGVFTELCTCFC